MSERSAAVLLVMGAAVFALAVPGRAENNGCPPGMSYLPGGSYTSAHKKKNAATVTAFCLDNYEVTTAQYAECQKSGKCTAIASGEGCNTAKKKEHPVNCVDWNQASAYCQSQGKRLPTLDEWEWAARGATAGNKYPWGNDKPVTQVCWYKRGSEVSEDSPSSTCKVGKPKGDVTPQGVFGMGGNVAEWTSTPGFNAETDRYLAGGTAWSSGEPESVSASKRIFYGKTDHDKDFGIRCAANPK